METELPLSSLIFTPLLVVHILAGTIAIGAGVTAMFARKRGSGLHTQAGNFFFGSMLVMAGSAKVLTYWEPDPLSMLNGVMVMYFVSTSWMAVRDHGKGWRHYEWALLPVAATLASALIVLGILATQSEAGIGGFSAEPFFVFGGIGLLAVALDLNYLMHGKVNQRQRIARHLWRMCCAYLIAATSLFLGQQDDVFFFMAGSPLLFVPSLATLVFMVFWLFRVRFAKNWLSPVLRLSPKVSPNTEIGT
ncbi:MAG: hypothetical protein AAGH53_12085 [Pseudomonadota bacterium]